MQEFSSVTASSYDADALTPLLNEKAAEGWDVVSIVAAGTNIVAYLTRTADDSAPVADSIADDVAPDADEYVASDELAAALPDEDAEPALPEAALVTTAIPTIAAAAPEPVEEVAAVEEPAGWAVAPEESGEAVSDAAVVAAVAEPEIAAVEEPAPVESAVPAGWYADPSGRFELRYWDGAGWTEHVSRGGQQFTDPPVA